jgi:4-carboxymuconolactone decarboxylase
MNRVLLAFALLSLNFTSLAQSVARPNQGVKAKPMQKRATMVEEQFGKISPGLVEYTMDVLFRDLWLRPDLGPRDRSLVTVSALLASGQVAQLTAHLNRAMDNGLTREQAGEIVTHLAFYAGWPNAFSAVSVVKDVLEKRPQ